MRRRGKYEGTEMFRVILSEPTGGARFDDKTDGGADTCILTVFIDPDEKAKERVNGLNNVLKINWDKNAVGHSNWKSQFKDALLVNGGGDDDDEEPAAPSPFDYFMHVLTV